MNDMICLVALNLCSSARWECRIVFRKSAEVDCCNSTQSFLYVHPTHPKPNHYWQHTSLDHVSYYYSKLKHLPYNSGGTLLTFSMILPTPKAELCSFWPQKRKWMMMMKGAAPIIETSKRWSFWHGQWSSNGYYPPLLKSKEYHLIRTLSTTMSFSISLKAFLNDKAIPQHCHFELHHTL